jgi:hypothetical protein
MHSDWPSEYPEQITDKIKAAIVRCIEASSREKVVAAIAGME